MIIPLTRLTIYTALAREKGEPQLEAIDHIKHIVEEAENSALTELFSQLNDINLELKKTYPGYSIRFEYHD